MMTLDMVGIPSLFTSFRAIICSQSGRRVADDSCFAGFLDLSRIDHDFLPVAEDGYRADLEGRLDAVFEPVQDHQRFVEPRERPDIRAAGVPRVEFEDVGHAVA